MPLVKAVRELKALFDDPAANVADLFARANAHEKRIAALDAGNDNTGSLLSMVDSTCAAYCFWLGRSRTALSCFSAFFRLRIEGEAPKAAICRYIASCPAHGAVGWGLVMLIRHK